MGTFLEYFDLMLYVHMAVLLNELFFPKFDPAMSALVAAGTFCTTYVLRPFGALFFGWVGDTIGRKNTIVITTVLMALSSLLMANLPTYAQIGIAASWGMMTCRILQGLSSMGEVIGALVYLVELIKPPARYCVVPIIPLLATLGGFAALGVASLINIFDINWRMIFWFGCIVAVVGIVARTTLRESAEFADARKRIANINKKNKSKSEFKTFHKQDKQSSLALFCLECMWPLCFYFSFIYCAEILRSEYHLSATEIIYQNLFVALADIVGSVIRVILPRFMRPLLILKYTLCINFFTFLVCPILLIQASSPFAIGVIQVLIIFFAADVKFAVSAIYPHFSILSRFRSTAFLYALSRAITYIFTSFGLIYLTNIFAEWGVAVALFIGLSMSAYGVTYFLKLQAETGDI
ncbi:MAG: MFS transporter [Rickettsiaceae bacterium]